jgi:rRNA-processing protein FCF1
MLVVDAANVVGSRPDGWWRDRAGAAARLVQSITDSVSSEQLTTPITIVLEGAARRGVEEREADGVRVVHARREGDDTIAEIAAAAAATGHRVTVVTADRELSERARESGCEVVGPRWLLERL